MQQYLQNKKGLVEGVFDQVYDRYDLMNDFMSLGIHRLWKKSLINMMGSSVNKKLVDVACGTGDIGKLFLDKTDNKSKVTSIDPNKKMISQGKNKLSKYKKENPKTRCVWAIVNPKPGCKKLCEKIIYNDVEIEKIQGIELFKLVFNVGNINYSTQIINIVQNYISKY